MMGQMGPNMGPGPPANMRFGGGPPMGGGPPRMGPRGQGFQSIPPSGPMMRQQQAGPGPGMMPNGPGDMQRIRFPPNAMMGPGGPGPPGQTVPVSHPSPQHAGSPGMWNNMGSGSPNPNNIQMQQQSIGSPHTPGIIDFLYKNYNSPSIYNSPRHLIN
jgi:hypothetical protein